MKIIRLILFGSILVFWPYLIYSQTNTNIGYEAGYMGSNNTNTGYQANDLIIGNDNSSLGANAGRKITTGNANVFIGHEVGSAYNTSRQNVFIGKDIGYNDSTGYYNTLIGKKSGGEIKTGIGNTFLGYYTGTLDSLGSYNSFIGFKSGMRASGSRNVFLGNEVGYHETGSHKLYIDNSDTGEPLIYGEFDQNWLSISNRLGVNTQNIADSIQLAVNGTVMAKEGIITTDYFPDFVFLPDYKLRGLDELKAFISHHGHLPDIPPAKVVESQGMKVGDMQKLLLQKIEELTLYMIEIQAENEQLINRLTELKAQRE
jgi:hypothetical protein